jgi:hypothetical protein
MKYFEIASASERASQARARQPTNQRDPSFERSNRKIVDASINSLYSDLMTALEKSMMNIEPGPVRRRR